MRARILATAAALLTGCVLLNPTSDHSAPVPATELCQRAAEVACEGHVRCCTEATLDLDICIAYARQGCADLYGPLLIDPRTGYDEAAAARALAEGELLAGACSTALSDWYVDRDGFRSALRGTVAGGDPCTPRDTMGGGFDLPALFSCADGDQACVVDVGAGAFSCAARRGVDGACLLSIECLDDLQCVRPEMGLGTCRPRIAIGAACMIDDECVSLVCRGGTCRERTVVDVYCGIAED